MGYNAAQELDNRLKSMIQQGSGEKSRNCNAVILFLTININGVNGFAEEDPCDEKRR